MKDIQTLIFSRKNFTKNEALKWAKKNKYKHYTSRLTPTTVRVRQFPPSQIKKVLGTFKIGNNIKALYVDRK